LSFDLDGSGSGRLIEYVNAEGVRKQKAVCGESNSTPAPLLNYKCCTVGATMGFKRFCSVTPVTAGWGAPCSDGKQRVN